MATHSNLCVFTLEQYNTSKYLCVEVLKNIRSKCPKNRYVAVSIFCLLIFLIAFSIASVLLLITSLLIMNLYLVGFCLF